MRTSFAIGALSIHVYICTYVCVASVKQDVWLTAIFPFTGGDYDGGLSQRHGAQIMLDEINGHSSLLPNYTLKVVWQDGKCSKAAGTNVFLKNLFDKQYDVWAPGILENEMDANSDGVITTAETDPFNAVWNVSQVTSDPVGLLGSGCAGTAMNIAQMAYLARWPTISHTATRPALSDRSIYPNFWRTILPDTFFNAAWMAMAKMLGRTSVIAIIGETENWGSMGVALVQAALVQGVELKGMDLSSEMAGFHGLQISMDSATAARDIASELKRLQQRIAIAQIFQVRLRLVLCEAYLQGYHNAIYMPMGWLPNGWWTGTDTDCTAEQITGMASGFVSANMMFWRNNLNTRLACSESMTAQAFKTEWFIRQGKTPGDMSNSPNGYFLTAEGATTADAVCMYAQMLHEILEVRKRPLADLTTRTSDAYLEIQEVLSLTHFEGVAGLMRFGPGEADPKGSIVLQQLQIQSGVGVLVDYASYTDGIFDFFGTSHLIFQFPGEDFDAWPPGPLVNFATCVEGTVLNYGTNLCEACLADSTFIPSLSMCLCNPGFFLNGTLCSQCPAGATSSSYGSTQCENCTAGWYAPAGSTACSFCSFGSYATSPGSGACTPCPQLMTTLEVATTDLSACVCDIGAFGAGGGAAGSCVACPAKASTINANSQANSACLCEDGSYMTSDFNTCLPCPEGMDCKLGNTPLHLKEGYWAASSDNNDRVYSVFECHAGKAYCKGGLAGAACATGRDQESIQCSVCKDMWTPGDNGECKECGGANLVPFIVAMILAFCVLCGLYYAIDKENQAKKPKTLVAAILLVALAILNIQQLGVVGSLAIDYGEPAKTLMTLANLLNFDIEILQLGCIFGQAEPTAVYSVKVCFMLGGLLVTVLLHALRHPTEFHKRIAALTATVGTMMLVFLVSLVNAAIPPFEHETHPCGKGTLPRYPTVITGESEHRGMMVLAVIFLFIPLSFVAFCAYIVKTFPQAMARGDVEFLQRWRFLFNRFRAETYWYILWFIVRNLLVALAPTLQIMVFQLSGITFVMALSAAVVAWFRPWVVMICNYVDITLNVCLVMIVATSGFVLDGDAEARKIHVVVLVMMFSLVSVIAVLLCIVYAVYSTIRNRGKKYWKYFLCHHKGGAGAFCRLVKVYLLKLNKGKFRVWLDCDDLQNLEMLFDYVGSQSEAVVIHMSKELFLRPWCMGELVTAKLKNVKMFPVRFPDFEDLTDEFIANYTSYVDISNLTPFFISLEMIQDMLAYVSDTKPLALPKNLAPYVIDGLARWLETGAVEFKEKPDDSQTFKVVVVVDHSNWEAVSTALVLVEYVRNESSDIMLMPGVLPPEAAIPSKAEYAAFVCSNGAFANPVYIKTLLAAEKQRTRFIPIISEDAFRFPSKALLEEIQTLAPKIFAPHGIKEAPSFIMSAISTIFKEIAVVFSPQDYSSNELLLQTKAKVVLGRISGNKLKALKVEEQGESSLSLSIEQPDMIATYV